MKTANGYPLKEEKVNVIAELEAKIEHFLENPDDKESFYYTSQTSGNVKEEIGGLTSAIHTQKKVIKDLDEIYIDPQTIYARVELIETLSKHKKVLNRADIEGCVEQVFGKGLMNFGTFPEGDLHKKKAFREKFGNEEDVDPDVMQSYLYEDLSVKYLDWAKLPLIRAGKTPSEAASNNAANGGKK